MTVHTFGDSHAFFGWRDLPYVATHYHFSTLCYSVGRDGLDRLDIRRDGVKEGDIVIYCYGEIDCRCHVNKHIDDTHTYQTIIDNIVEKYVEVIKLNQALFGNITTCIFNVVPPARKGAYPEVPEVPQLGTDEERSEYTRYFNSKLQEACKANNFIFVDVYNKYADSDGFLNSEYSDGIVHIKNPVFIEEFMKTHVL